MKVSRLVGVVLLSVALMVLAAACTDSARVEDSVGGDTTASSVSSATTASAESLTTKSSENAAGPGTSTPDNEPSDIARVFVPSGLTPEFRHAAAKISGVRRLAQIDVAPVDMVSSVDAAGRKVDELVDGFRIQLDARAFHDLPALSELAPLVAAAVADLEDDEVLLTEASAELRRLDVGGRITFISGETLTVAGIVPEEEIGSVEIVFAGASALEAAGAVSVRPALLVDFDGDAAVLEEQLLEVNEGTGVRVFGGRGAEDRDLPTPVLSPLEVKQQFGEFSFRPAGGRSVEIDEEWFDENIVLRRVPIIGRVRCHRVYTNALVEVMSGLARDGMEDMIDISAYQGCWTPRFIGGSQRLSRHSWGIAADINFGNDLDYSLGSPVHPILLNRMAEAGLVSGHRWVNADPGHFEYVGDPADE